MSKTASQVVEKIRAMKIANAQTGVGQIENKLRERMQMQQNFRGR